MTTRLFALLCIVLTVLAVSAAACGESNAGKKQPAKNKSTAAKKPAEFVPPSISLATGEMVMRNLRLQVNACKKDSQFITCLQDVTAPSDVIVDGESITILPKAVRITVTEKPTPSIEFVWTASDGMLALKERHTQTAVTSSCVPTGTAACPDGAWKPKRA